MHFEGVSISLFVIQSAAVNHKEPQRFSVVLCGSLRRSV